MSNADSSPSPERGPRSESDRAGAGHVFVVGGDLTRLACDDAIVPTDRGLNVSASWIPLLPDGVVTGHDGDRGDDDRHKDGDRDDETDGQAGVRVRGSWPGDSRVLPLPPGDAAATWLVDTAGDEGRGLPWLLDGVRQALAAVAEREVREPPTAGTDASSPCPPSGPAGAWRPSSRCSWGAGVSVTAGLPTWSRMLDELAELATLDPRVREGLSALSPAGQRRAACPGARPRPPRRLRRGALLRGGALRRRAGGARQPAGRESGDHQLRPAARVGGRRHRPPAAGPALRHLGERPALAAQAARGRRAPRQHRADPRAVPATPATPARRSPARCTRCCGPGTSCSAGRRCSTTTSSHRP